MSYKTVTVLMKKCGDADSIVGILPPSLMADFVDVMVV